MGLIDVREEEEMLKVKMNEDNERPQVQYLKEGKTNAERKC